MVSKEDIDSETDIIVEGSCDKYCAQLSYINADDETIEDRKLQLRSLLEAELFNRLNTILIKELSQKKDELLKKYQRFSDAHNFKGILNDKSSDLLKFRSKTQKYFNELEMKIPDKRDSL